MEKNRAIGSEARAADLSFNSSIWNYDAANNVYWQIGVIYCANPVATAYESLGIYVPGAYMSGSANGDGTYTCVVNADGVVNGYSAMTAPVVMPVNTPGYSAQSSPTSYNYSSVSNYLEAGFVYVHSGCRGRDNGYDNAGNLIYSGGAPWGVTDLKAAVRYLRYNNDVLPGSTSRIFTMGHSGGGAQSSLMGATGDSPLYFEYLESIGAAMTDAGGGNISDAICGAMCWCPITSLDQANEAYEWMMGQYSTTGTRAEGTWTSAFSDDMSAEFVEYINRLGLVDSNGSSLTLSESTSGIYTAGSYYAHVFSEIERSLNNFLIDTEFPYTSGGSGPGPGGGESVTYETVQDYIDSLNSDETWVTYDADTNTATVSSVGAFVTCCKTAGKDVGAFDDLNRGQAENILFGDDEHDALHFDSIMTRLLEENQERYAGYSGWDASYVEAYQEYRTSTDALGNGSLHRQAMYNPMYFLCDYYDGYRSSTVASYWRIHSGIEQGDTSLTVEMNLALALRNYDGIGSVEFESVWAQGHTMAERTGDSTSNFISWINGLFAADTLVVESGTNHVVSDRQTYTEVIIEEGGSIGADASLGYSGVTLTVSGVETSIVSGRVYTGVVVLTPVRSLADANSAWSAFRTAIYVDGDGVNDDYTVMETVIAGDVTGAAATNLVMRSETDISSWRESFNGILINAGAPQNSPQGFTLSDYSSGGISFNYVFSNPDLAYTGPGGNDFIGLGAAVMASGNSRVLLRGSMTGSDIANAAALVKANAGIDLTGTYGTNINNAGQVRTTLVAEESAVVVIDGAYTKAADGEWIAGYIGSVSPDTMKSVPWMLGLYGNVRANNLLDNATGLYINSILESENWGVLSTDESDRVQLEVENCIVRGTGVSAYGVYSIGSANISVTDSYMFIPTYAAISANGNNSTEFKNTEIYSGRAGAMYHSGFGTVAFTDSEVQVVRELALMRANTSTTFNLLVNNSRVSFTGAEDNILVQLMDNDDVLDSGTMQTTVNFTDPAFAHGNNDNSLETARAYFESLPFVTTGLTQTAAFSNVNVTGNIYNSSVEYGADLTVLLSASSLEGVVSSSVGLHEKETLVSVWDSNGLTGSEDYELLGKLTNYAFESRGNDVSLSLENASTWIVTGTSYLTSLTIDSTSSIVAASGYKVTLTVDGAERGLTAGQTCAGNVVLTVTKESSETDPD